MSEQEIHQIELSIEQAEEIVKKGDMARRLSNNSDFHTLITEGFIRDEASRLTLLLNDPSLNEEQREFVLKDLYGIGALQRYMQNTVHFAEMAARDINYHRQTLEEVREEELAAASGVTLEANDVE